MLQFVDILGFLELLTYLLVLLVIRSRFFCRDLFNLVGCKLEPATVSHYIKNLIQYIDIFVCLTLEMTAFLFSCGGKGISC